MESWGTIILGYAIVFGTIVAYAYSVVARGRAIGSQLDIGADSDAVTSGNRPHEADGRND